MSEREQLERAIAHLEAQRAILGDAVVEAALAPLRQQLVTPEQEISRPALEGERKLVTVLFADIAGFTALSERLDPEEVVALTNAVLNKLAEARKTELINQAYQRKGSDKLVGLKMADVYKGLELILLPSSGKDGINPLSLEGSLNLFGVNQGKE